VSLIKSDSIFKDINDLLKVNVKGTFSETELNLKLIIVVAIPMSLNCVLVLY